MNYTLSFVAAGHDVHR